MLSLFGAILCATAVAIQIRIMEIDPDSAGPKSLMTLGLIVFNCFLVAVNLHAYLKHLRGGF